MNLNSEKQFYKDAIEAVLKNEHPFYFVYQMHAKNINGKINTLNSAESLTRFPKFQNKEINPYLFFLTLEELDNSSNNSAKLQKMFLFRQLEHLASELEANIDNLSEDFIVSFNVSPSVFDEDFRNTYLEIFKKHHKISPRNIAIELTEVAPFPVHSNQKAKKEHFTNLMTSLKNCGTVFLLDDFNSGYSNEQVLSEFPFDIVKIDNEKFKELSDQIVKPNFGLHFASNAQTGEKLSGKNIFDSLLEVLAFQKQQNRSMPKKIICEGLRENSCPSDPQKNIPLLVKKYYGKQLKALGYNENTVLFQGYEINKPCKMSELVGLTDQNQPS